MQKYLVSVALSLLCFSAGATDIDCTPGALKDVLTSPASVTDLSITGSVDASDLFFIDSNCPSIKTLDLSAVTIEAYSGSSLRSHTTYAAATIPAHTFAGSSLTSVSLPASGAVTVGEGAFAGSALESLTIPASVVAVGDAAFSSCPDLKDVTFGTTTLGVGTFADCRALQTVTVTSPVALASHTFSGDTSLATVTGAAYFTSIGDNAFAGCTDLKHIDLGSALSSIGSSAFARSGIEAIDLAPCKSLSSVGDWAFAEMPALTTLSLGSVAEVGRGVAFGSKALTTASHPATAELADYAFAGTSSLTDADLLPEGITSIGDYAMAGMSGVQQVLIPASVEYIGSHAMQDMTSLKSIGVASAPAALGSDVWSGVNQSEVSLFAPKEYLDNYNSADQWQNFTILQASDSTDPIASEIVGGLRGRFAGDDLIIAADGIDLADVAVYDPAGMLLVRVTPSEPVISIDTRGCATRIFIVAATLADGSTANLKLAKK